ncbi:MAG: hemolysin family protein [Opitutales bacterium]
MQPFLLFGLILFSLGIKGCLAAFEYALVALRYGNIRGENLNETSGKDETWLQKIADNAPEMSASLRFLRTSLIILSGVLGATWWAKFVTPLSNATLGSWIVAWFLVPLFGLYAYYILSDRLPRAIAQRHSLKVLKLFYPVTLAIAVISRPLRWPVKCMEGLLDRAFKVEDKDDIESMDVEVQTRALGMDTTSVSPVARKIINRALYISDLVVHDILLPRNQVKIFDINDSNSDNLKIAQESGHTRFPLCSSDLDRCLGIIHIKDIFRQAKDPLTIDFRSIKRPILSLREDEGLEEALQKLLKRKVHMALVNDEFGGVLGVVTLEHILEELVGEIQDEFDSEESLISPLEEDGVFKISGLAPIHEVEDHLNLEIDNEDVSTFGGLITQEAGRIPKKGERIELDRFDIEVTEVDGTRVINAKVRILPESEDNDSD